MRKKFRTKRHIKVKFIPYLIIIFIVFISIIILTYISSLNLIKNNVVTLLENSNVQTINIKNLKKDLVTLISGFDVNKPITLLEKVSNYEKNKVIAFNFSRNEVEKNMIEIDNNPVVYIYNTHQTEEYVSNDLSIPTPTVLTGAYYLRDLLEKMGIKTLVEETSIKDILNENNWNYTQSYRASRINLEKVKNEYPSIKIFIDFHRDAVPRSLSTVSINDKSYAKVLFVIGKEHDNYLENLNFTNELNSIIETNYPTLTKGILQKEGPGVNGIYNQDIKENVILMEVGGNENTLEEVTNTLDLIAPVIKEKING